MARNAAVTVENNFTRGLITEAGKLNFPENAVTDTDNCVYDQLGRVTRRLGFDYEKDYTNFSITRNDESYETFVWETVGGNGNLSFVVVQKGKLLYFYEVDEDGALSPNRKTSTVDIETFAASGYAADFIEYRCQFTSGDGKLFVTHPFCDPFYVTYDSGTETFTGNLITIKIRDFEGVDDGLDVDERPASLTNAHKYNLFNQGWYADVQKGDTTSVSLDNAVDYWDSLRTDFPSNSDVWWYYSRAQASGDTFGELALVPGQADSQLGLFGNTPAPKGHYILEAFNQDRSTASGIASVTSTSAGANRPVAVAFAAGRVFYGGVSAEKYNSNIYFTRIVENEDHYGQCYQDNDPTSKDFSDLLPSDGGVIVIPEIGNVIKLVPVQDSIVVVASNGVWSITGSDNGGFKANDYRVRKITNNGAVSASSFVIVDGFPMWWNDDGIYVVAVVDNIGTLGVQSVTDKTIKTFFDRIPIVSKKWAKGAYNEYNKVVHWMYRSLTPTTINLKNEYDSVLALNIQTGAFYKYTINQTENDQRIVSVFSSDGESILRTNAFLLTSDGEIVTDSDGNYIVTESLVTPVNMPSFRYLTLTPVSGSTYNMTFSQEKDNDYLDWTDGSYSSYFITGFKIHGEAIKKFQMNWLVVYSINEPSSSCQVRSIWDYANNTNSNRYSSPQQIYRSRLYYDVVTSRLKIRGHGKICQLKFESEGPNPFNIIGWGTFETANTIP